MLYLADGIQMAELGSHATATATEPPWARYAEGIETNALEEIELVARSQPPDWLKGILVRYLGKLESGLADLHSALESEDSTKLAALAHHLKSSSRTIGASRLGAQLEHIEHGARCGELAGMPTLLATVDAESENVRIGIRDYILDMKLARGPKVVPVP